MTLRTHDSTKLRTTHESQGLGIQGDVTVSIGVAATLTRERTIPTDIRTRVYPAATTSYEQPEVGDIILAGFENTTTFGTHEVLGGNITIEFTGFTNSFTINPDNVVGREHGVVEGWHEFEGFEGEEATFGDFELIQDLFVTPDGFDGSEEQFGDQFMVTWDVTYDFDSPLDDSGSVVFGDLEAFFGVVENNWVEDEPLDPSPWGRIT